MVDPAQYQRRLDEFDFDVTVVSFPASQTPGNELVERFSSAAADEGADFKLRATLKPQAALAVANIRLFLTADKLSADEMLRVGREGIEGMRHFYTEEKTVTIALKRPPMERLGAA